eukprot:652826-Prorocentrum_minimum.AAC.1
MGARRTTTAPISWIAWWTWCVRIWTSPPPKMGRPPPSASRSKSRTVGPRLSPRRRRRTWVRTPSSSCKTGYNQGWPIRIRGV